MASPNNRGSIQTRFTHRFLRALNNLTNNHHSSSSSAPENSRRFYNVKRAAYASMAVAVGRRRAWSRAQLLRIRRRRMVFLSPAEGKIGAIQRKYGRRNPSDPTSTTRELRELVPGGEVMDWCSLLDETAHYISCLSSQVQAMRNIVDLLST